MTNNIKLYDKMTITITSNEKQDTEMMDLIEKLKKAQETRESVEKVTIPKIEAIGRAKWIVIANQLLELCKTAEEIGIRSQLSNFMLVSFNRDDTGELYSLRLGWSSYLKIYTLTFGYADTIHQDTTLTPVEEYCPKNELEDKDGWLSKWDEYDIYNKFRSKLMKEIQRRTEVENTKTNEILDRYAEFAKVGQ